MGEPSDDPSSSSRRRDPLHSPAVQDASNVRGFLTVNRNPAAADSRSTIDQHQDQHDYFDAQTPNTVGSHHDQHTHHENFQHFDQSPNALNRPATSPQIIARDDTSRAESASYFNNDVRSNVNGGSTGINDRNAINEKANGVSAISLPDPASNNTQVEGEKPSSLKETSSGGDASGSGTASTQVKKPPIPTRMKAGSIRFISHTKDALCRTYFNVLLVFVPIGIAVHFAGLDPAIVFAMNAVAIVPLAGLLTHATESVASRLGDTLGALLNVSFGNAVELIIFIIALVKNEIRIVQASLLGSILANLLLILGMAFLLGGLRFREQIYNSTVTQMSAVLLSLSVMSLLLPTAFHASFSDAGEADSATLRISRGTSVVLLLVYILYLLFQLKSHAYLYESTPQEMIDAESHPGPLADVLDTSSSSDSSSTSSSDTDTTSGSHTTAKRRIKKFIKRTRRKSSSTSQETGSIPSYISSPVNEGHFHFDRRGSRPSSVKALSRRPSHHDVKLKDIASGDEADLDVQKRRQTAAAPRIRDFQTGETSLSPERLKALEKQEKQERKRRRHHRHKKGKSHVADKIELGGIANEPMVEAMHEKPVEEVETPAPKTVNFAEAQDTVPSMQRSDSQPGRRPFYRGLSSAARPGIQKFMSQNVFVAAPASNNLGMPITGANVLAPVHRAARPTVTQRPTLQIRRTNSLPGRLGGNSRAQSTNFATTEAPQVRRPLPPYIMRVPPPTVMAEAQEDAEGGPIVHEMSRTSAVVMLLVSTGLVALCAEFLVDAIPEMTNNSSVSQAFIGLIILPIVGNAAEHVTAVTVATKNKMDLAIGVAVGSSIQIALFVTPLVVILGWILGKGMSLYFNLFETVSLFVTVFVVNFLVLDGKSNYLEGTLLIAAYVIIAVCAFFYPDSNAQSALGGSEGTQIENAARSIVFGLLRF